jgi:signal transduction histidine kinase
VSRVLDRIWVRFGLGIACSVLASMLVLGGTMIVYGRVQYWRFHAALPEKVRVEFDELRSKGLEGGPRASEIYRQYSLDDDPWDVDQLAILIGLLACLPVGLVSGFWISRMVMQPISSVARAAGRVALGDFGARARVPRRAGEMADLVHDFNLMTSSLEALERERKSTLAALSHELRTPLAVLQARLHALCDGVIPAEPAEFSRLLEQCQHLSLLVGDLHTLSVADAGRLPLHRVALDIPSLVRDTLENHARRLDDAGMKVELEVRAVVPPVLADADRIRQVLNNLIENAIHYARDGHWLHLWVRSTPGEVQITVSDAGRGHPDGLDERVFQRFTRLDASRNRATGGSGLGLSIVRTLIELHGGTVSVGRSRRGGAAFTISIPRGILP